jgi:hypothetical protein
MKGAHEISALHKSECHGDRGHHQGSYSGDHELVQERTIALVLLCAGEQALYFFSQQHDCRQAQYAKRQRQECIEGGSPGTAGGGGCVRKVLAAAHHFAPGEFVKVDGYVCQEETQDDIAYVQA